MKRKEMYVVGVVVILAMILIGSRYYMLNKVYSNPVNCQAGLNEKLILGDYTFEMGQWEWKDGTILKDMMPEYIMLFQSDGNEYPPEKEKVAFVSLTITKNSSTSNYLDLSNIGIESGAWHDQWDGQVFEHLNGEDGLVLHMEEGEERNILIPVVLYEFQFSKKEWENIENREFRVVLENYPEKYMLVNK